jgi:hypothetical protein
LPGAVDRPHGYVLAPSLCLFGVYPLYLTSFALARELTESPHNPRIWCIRYKDISGGSHGILYLKSSISDARINSYEADTI